MKKNKFDHLNLYCGIHTVSIRTDQQPKTDSSGNLPVGVEDRGMSKTGMLTLKINPNKYVGDGVELYSFADYCSAMRSILSDIGIDHYYYNRIDVRFDSYSARYEDVDKLNRALILSYWHINRSTHNIYQSDHGWSKRRLSFAFHGNTSEIESYNKEEEDPTGLVLSRLEVRSVRQQAPRAQQSEAIKPLAVMQSWKAALRGSVPEYDKMLADRNKVLEEEYSKGKAQGRYPSINSFVRQNIGDVYSTKQLDDLFSLLDAAQPTKARYNFIQRNPLLLKEFFSTKDLQSYVDYLCVCMDRYISAPLSNFALDDHTEDRQIA